LSRERPVEIMNAQCQAIERQVQYRASIADHLRDCRDETWDEALLAVSRLYSPSPTTPPSVSAECNPDCCPEFIKYCQY